MKIAEWLHKYLTPRLVWVGIAQAGIVYLLVTPIADKDGPYASLLYSLLAPACTIPILAIAAWLDDRKYRDAEALLGAPALFTIRVRFMFLGESRSGRLFASSDAMVLLGRDTRPRADLRYERGSATARLVIVHTPHSAPDDGWSARRLLSHARLILETPGADDECHVMPPNCAPLFNHLRSSGWRCVP